MEEVEEKGRWFYLPLSGDLNHKDELTVLVEFRILKSELKCCRNFDLFLQAERTV